MSVHIQGYELQGDNIVLDILAIAYVDLGRNNFTSYSKLINLINKVYHTNDRLKLNHTITTVTSSHWFGRAGKNVHLNERGVEFYLQFIQSYKSQKDANQAIELARESIMIARYTMLLTLATLIVTIIVLFLK